MAFSVTLNGRAYTEADFTSALYHINYPSFLRDCTEHLSYSLSSIGTTAGLSDPTPTTLYVFKNRNFCVGMPIVIHSPTWGATHFATITSYNGSYSGTQAEIVCTIHKSFGNVFAIELGEWIVTVGGSLNVLASGPYAGSNGLGATTVAAVRISSVNNYPTSRYDHFLEDFCGYIPSLEATEGLTIGQNLQVPGLLLEVGGGASLSFDGNQQEAFADGNCPGVAVLTVKTPGDYVWIAGEGQASTADAAQCAFRFFLPETVEGEEFEVYLGYSYTAYSPSSPELLYGICACFNFTAPRNSDGKYPIEARYNALEDSSTFSDVSRFDKSQVWEQGRWLSLHLLREDVTNFEFIVYDGTLDSTSNYSEEVSNSFLGGYGTSVTDCYPFVFLRKKKGSAPVSVYLDYIASYNNDLTR